MGAEGEQGALARVDIGRGVGGRPAVLVDQHALRHGHALVAGDPRLAEGDGAGGHVEQQLRLGAGPWHGGGERVGAEAGVAAAIGRLQRAVVGDVDEVDGDHAGGRALLGPMADPADMGAVAQGHGDGALRPGALDPLPHGLLGHGLAEAAPCVEHQHAAFVGHQLEPSGWAPADLPAAGGHSRAACRRHGCRGRRGWRPPDARRRRAPRLRCCPWRGRRGGRDRSAVRLGCSACRRRPDCSSAVRGWTPLLPEHSPGEKCPVAHSGSPRARRSAR